MQKKKKKKVLKKNLMPLEELHVWSYKLPECIHERKKKKSFLQQLEKQDLKDPKEPENGHSQRHKNISWLAGLGKKASGKERYLGWWKRH